MTTDTVKAADAALLRALANWWDPPYKRGWGPCVNNESHHVTGARLRSLADVLERHEGEIVECEHGRLAGRCGICDNDE